jgi:hypothetical protein
VTRGIAVAGAIARRPGAGGHAWALAQFALGFARLGWEVTFVDRIDCGPAAGAELAWVDRVMRGLGLRGDHVVLGPGGESLAGLPRTEVRRRLGRASALLNVMGYLDDEELLGAAPLRVFLDIDPGYAQMWHELGLADILGGHDAYVTVGSRVGRPGCGVPTCGRSWIPTAPPVVLELWPECPGGDAFTSVATWRGAYGTIEFGGETYGSRVHEFRRFTSLPARVHARFDVALDIHAADGADAAALTAAGWNVLDPARVAGDPDAYRAFVQGSLAEICVAQSMYVKTGSGWFSDRSACYLASGKPVVAQDTGFSRTYPCGRGLLAFDDLDGAAAAVEEVARDPRGHGRAARELTREHLDSGRVLTALARELGLT